MLRNLIFTLCVSIATPSLASSTQTDELCHEKIHKALCLVDPPTHELDRYKLGRPCLPGGEAYTQQIIDQYDMYPPIAQKALCSVRTIYIETSFKVGAWSNIENESDLDSCMIGLSKKELDGHYTLQDYNSWFEQQSFGGSEDISPLPNLPMMIVIPESKKNINYLSGVLLHEIGHIVDFQNHINQFECAEDGSDCKVKQGSWSELSWIDTRTLKMDSDFAERNELCLNNCSGKFIPVNRADQIYKAIFEHGFISQLATLSPYEDWAEFFTYYINAKYMDIYYKIVLPSGAEFNMDDAMNSYLFREKKRYLDIIEK